MRWRTANNHRRKLRTNSLRKALRSIYRKFGRAELKFDRKTLKASPR